MKILIPVAAYHEYNTAVYVEAALRQLGHEAQVITQAEFYGCKADDADLFFGVDSAGPLDFPIPLLHKTTMWFIDSRHNNNPARRKPDDDSNAKKLVDGGGWVFQAQARDWQRNINQEVMRSCWLPLAADPDVWQPDPEARKVYDVGFGGNIWCETRRTMLDEIAKKHIFCQFTGPPQALVDGYNASKIGFNVSSFYGTPVAYDINMRVFEVMACGIPLVTNHLPELTELGVMSGIHCMTYKSPDVVLSLIQVLLTHNQGRRREMGERARQLILDGHTYQHRMEEALEIVTEAGILNDK